MYLFVILTFLFSIGAISGWCIEVVYRKFFSNANPERKWINPGFCVGPWLPLYGFGLIGLYTIATFAEIYFDISTLASRIILFVVMAIAMTIVEFIAGEYCLRVIKVKLWDYSHCKGNIDTVICPLFTFYWGVLGMTYFFGLHPHLESLVSWLLNHQLYTFFVGMFYGVFVIDLVYSSHIISKIHQFAKEHDFIVEIERIRLHVHKYRNLLRQKNHFFLVFHGENTLQQHLILYREKMQKQNEETKEKW